MVLNIVVNLRKIYIKMREGMIQIKDNIISDFGGKVDKMGLVYINLKMDRNMMVNG